MGSLRRDFMPLFPEFLQPEGGFGRIGCAICADGMSDRDVSNEGRCAGICRHHPQVAMELAPSGQLIVTAAGDVYGPDSPENRELARRLRACINACAGLTTEDLENGLIQELCRTVMQVAPLLQAQERELKNRAA